MPYQKKVTLGDVLDHLKEVGETIAKDKPLLDIGTLLGNDHHQTAVFLRFPYPGVFSHPKVADRVNKFLSSINRPDTIKADLFTVLGGNCVAGFQPHIKWPTDENGEPVRGGLFNPDDFIANQGYVLQITIDVVLPDVLEHALGIHEAKDPQVAAVLTAAFEALSTEKKIKAAQAFDKMSDQEFVDFLLSMDKEDFVEDDGFPDDDDFPEETKP